MKPNDKAYQAARAEGKRWGKNLIRKENQIPSWKVLRQSDKQYGYDVIAEFNNHKDRDEALERLRAEAMVDAAYAAQFKSEEYAGLVKELRAECRDWLTADCVEKAADALEALLVERDALMAVNAEFSVVFKERDAAIAERDALAARLAPVEDEKLTEIVARAICLNRAAHACNCKENGACKAPLENLREYNEVWPQARAAIAAAIRSGK